MDVEGRLDKVEVDLAAYSNFLNLLVVGDRSLGSEIRRNKRDNVLHSKAQKRTLAKTVENVAGMEGRLSRMEKQISLLFDTVGRIENLLRTKADRPIKIRLKT